MSSVCKLLRLVGLGVLAVSGLLSAELRVCADPNNLPFSNRREQGFENKLATMLASDLDAHLRYFWWPQRRGFLRYGLNAQQCDVIMGMPSATDSVATTRPYYRSSYVFVAPKGVELSSDHWNVEQLKLLRIGISVVGDDYSNVPPAQALIRLGLAPNLVGYSIYGDYSKEAPPADIVRAVEKGDVDVAVVWGPLAGYFANRSSVPLNLTPVPQTAGAPPMTFNLSMAVRPADAALRRKLDQFIVRRGDEIRRLLARYHVPLSEGGEP